MGTRLTASSELEAAAKLDSLYRRHCEALRRYIASTFGAGPPDPEDVVQIAFEKFAGLENPGHVENPAAFLKTTARNYVLDQRRRMKVRADHARSERDTSGESDDVDAERVLVGRERWDILERAIRTMDSRKREVLIMNRIHGLSYAEIARRKGFSQTLAKMLVAEALVQCERALREAGGE